METGTPAESVLIQPIQALSNPVGYSVQSNNSKVLSAQISLQSDWNFFVLNSDASLMISTPNETRPKLVGPRAVFFASNEDLHIQFGRGLHHFTFLMWRHSGIPYLASWVDAHHEVGRNSFCQGVDPGLSDTFDRFQKCLSNDVTATPRTVGLLYEVIPQLISSDDNIQLAPLPADLPETIQALVNRVRADSAVAWHLKDAADQAGYSPFHFSRVFKSLVGYGFHEYVERCRTLKAVKILLETETSVDTIAAICGFGTTQGLREAVKQYIGLVPSELRIASGVAR